MKKLLIATAGLLAGTAVLAQTPPSAPAAPQPPMAHPMQDRVMTRAEVVQMVREHFGKMDADKNGAISKEEITKLHSDRIEHRIHGGGAPMAMVHHERLGDPNIAFDRLDANKDGSISRDEFSKAREERIERRIERIEKIREGAPRDGKQVRRFMRHRGGGFGGRMIVMADTNKDGQITLAEAETMALQHFHQMDANRDGQVTREERRAGRPLIIKRMREEKKSGS
jgi:Ca2+-binding EF-hand superfamily protein